jgi:hypothetical protein
VDSNHRPPGPEPDRPHHLLDYRINICKKSFLGTKSTFLGGRIGWVVRIIHTVTGVAFREAPGDGAGTTVTDAGRNVDDRAPGKRSIRITPIKQSTRLSLMDASPPGRSPFHCSLAPNLFNPRKRAPFKFSGIAAASRASDIPMGFERSRSAYSATNQSRVLQTNSPLSLTSLFFEIGSSDRLPRMVRSAEDRHRTSFLNDL